MDDNPNTIMGNDICIIRHTVKEGESVSGIAHKECDMPLNKAGEFALAWAEETATPTFDLDTWTSLTKENNPHLHKVPIARIREEILKKIARRLKRSPEALPKDIPFVLVKEGDVVAFDITRRGTTFSHVSHTEYRCAEKSKSPPRKEKKLNYLWEQDPALSQADYLRKIEIGVIRLAASAECNEDSPQFFNMPASFPDGWPYATKYVPVSNSLLFDSPYRDSIPTLKGPKAESLAKDKEESDKRHFWNMLVATIPQLNPMPQGIANRSSRKIKILDVGCGSGWDATDLASYFGGTQYGVPNDNVDYVGIDINGGAIRWARKYHARIGWPGLRFEDADATCLDEHPFTQDKFDVIVIRHPEVYTKYNNFITKTWLHIFKEAMLHLAEGGMLLVTTYACHEYLGADKTLTSYGAKRVFLGLNPFSADIRLNLNFNRRDRYVAVYTKESPDRILEEEKRVRILCGEEALSAKEDTIQVSKERVTAQTAEGRRYEVRIEWEGTAVVYRDLASGREKYFTLKPDSEGRAQQIASNGTDTFIFVNGEDKERIGNIFTNDTKFYKINWEEGKLGFMAVGGPQDFSIRSRHYLYVPGVYNTGFCIADGKLLGEAEVREPWGESGFMFHRHLNWDSNMHYRVEIKTGPLPFKVSDTVTHMVSKLSDWLSKTLGRTK